MSNDTAKTITTNIVPVQGIFTPDAELVTLIGPAGTPFNATISPEQSGLHITDSTIDSTPIGVTTPAEGHFTSATVEDTPVGSTDVANKLYVDSVAAGLSWKQPVVCATTAPITLHGLQTIDLVTVTEGQRVLVKNQGSASANGIYNASAGDWTRSEDANTWNELISAITFIESGSQDGSAWYCSAQPGGTLGATPVNWSNFSVAGQYFAGTGLTLDGYTFKITDTGVTAASYGSGTAVPVLGVNAQGQITSASTASITPSGIGAVASVTASAPVASSGGTNPNISMAAASASADGYLTSSDWSTFNGKQPAGTYVTAVTGTAPVVSSGGTTPAISMHVADASNSGYLSSTDWSTFNSKVSMVYPGAGIPNSTGSAWGTSYSTSGTGTVLPLATAATINNPTMPIRPQKTLIVCFTTIKNTTAIKMIVGTSFQYLIC